jgi:hypothetical protein
VLVVRTVYVQWKIVQEEDPLEYVMRNFYFILLYNFEHYSMDWYPFKELAVMHPIYGCANGNGVRAEHLSQGEQIPSPT